MEWINLVKALFLGVVEGLTEFIPVSSTGHLIIVGDWLSFHSNGKVFEVVIQLGAVLAVCWLYRAKIISLLKGLFTGSMEDRRFAGAVLIAFFPAAVIGALFIGTIKAVLFNPLVVACSLIVGGLIIFWAENRKSVPSVNRIEDLRWHHALLIGFAQCFAMIPGTSRSGATIIGGMFTGLSRQTATEFSFFLAMPTMLGASVYDGWKHHHLLNNQDILAIAIGFTAAFFSALLVVRALVRFVANHTFKVFAWYRIALGLLIFILMFANVTFSTNA